MKVHRIIPGIYQRGHTEHLPVSDRLATCASLGITSAVNLWTPRDDILGNTLNYYHFPIPDGLLSWETQRALEQLSEHIVRSLSVGDGWLIQCHAGRNRSGLLSALVVRQALGLSGRLALAHVRLMRPGSVANPHFEAYLNTLGDP
jgi:hypothetical protein